MKRKKLGHQRVVTISVCLPVTVELLVETLEDEVDDDTDWEIAEVRNSSCCVYPGEVAKQLDEDEYLNMCAKAYAAKDV